MKSGAIYKNALTPDLVPLSSSRLPAPPVGLPWRDLQKPCSLRKFDRFKRSGLERRLLPALVPEVSLETQLTPQLRCSAQTLTLTSDF